MKNGFPKAGIDQVVGLFGGSFDPPHPGHVHVTHAALRAFGLDRVWWLVSPGNPLKARGPAALERRLQAARAVMRHPRVEVTALEEALGTRATADTLRRLQSIYPRVRFVWLMGADNLTQFHRWKDWRYIMDTVPVGVLARPGDRLPARLSVAAKTYAQFRLDAQASRMLGRAEAPAWCFVNVPLVDESSTRIRSRGVWSGQ